jgi:GT2 family glycosyltransferase
LSELDFPVVPLVNGFCTLFRRDALEAIGWFDDDTFPEGYGEENDLCIRLGQAGWQLRIADHAYVHHKKSRSFGAARRTTLASAAAKALRSRHPTVAIDQLEAAMQGCEPINRLRTRLTAALRTEQSL